MRIEGIGETTDADLVTKLLGAVIKKSRSAPARK